MNELPLLSCDGCGACCMSMGHPRFFWRPEAGITVDPHWVDVPGHLKAELESHINGLEEMDLGQPCIWFNPETLKCNHYEHRPQMCRDFEIGNPHCLRMRLQRGIDDRGADADRSSERGTE